MSKFRTMLQRIQSVFFAIIVILGVLFSFLPILAFTSDNMVYVMYAYQTVTENELTNVVAVNLGVGVMQGLVFLVALATIFLFKNRQLQVKLSKLNILLIAVQITAITLYSDTVKAAIGKPIDDILVSFKFAAIIPIISLILTYLAIRFIKKDDKLVKAADRIR